MRFIQIFSTAFFVFFLAGICTEYEERRNVSDDTFILDFVSGAFAATKKSDLGILYYTCNTTSYRYDFSHNTLEPITALAVPTLQTKPSLTSDEIAVLTTGLGVGEVAALVRLSAGLTSKDKVAALLGGLSGFA